MTSKTRWALLLVILLAAGGAGGYYYWHSMLHGDHAEQGGEAAARQYTCPMHPFILKDKAGACPICGMSLVPVGGAGAAQGDLSLPEAVHLSPAQLVMANVATAPVEEIPLTQEVRAVGIVTYDQAKQGKVTAWVPGRIERLYVNRVGDTVSRGRPVALLYAPELVSAQQEYLLALRSRDELKRSRIPSIAESGEGLVKAARQRLKLWGVSDKQLAALEQGGEPAVQLPINTPLSGVVIEKLVVEGQYVAEGEALFSVADLTTVWVELALYENEFPAVAVGQEVAIASQSYPGETFAGKVTYVYPFLDPQTRTVKVRVEIPNPGLRLKPDMYVEGILRKELGTGYAVPVTAVIDTGRRKVVWVQEQEGVFSPRDVKVGARVGEKVQILEGVDDFDIVAVSGGYLIDSEAQLRGPGGGAHAGHGAAAEGEQAKPAAAPTPAGHQH
ncbi:RND transporter [Desulfuromonas versatilis]|uniref:RND transporter n=1 Tax=Desulfuromonas versatilis TaxID=2802975 RepID=A0ABM8HQQ6_9BACT|nr:efflux RND transporter periplasmic adaptor subunit [Desulfuromonas versatilis]BCR04558.1 RND transporter [Desulfuromonas versatilis]